MYVKIVEVMLPVIPAPPNCATDFHFSPVLHSSIAHQAVVQRYHDFSNEIARTIFDYRYYF